MNNPAKENKPSSAPPSRNFRLAATLNLFLPGLGLIYLGERLAGALLAGAFLACLAASLIIFLTGYVNYLNLALSGQILEGDRLERVSNVFHPRWLIGLLAVGVIIYVASMAGLIKVRRRIRKDPVAANEKHLPGAQGPKW